jgi:SpoIID/LytB domain protein
MLRILLLLLLLISSLFAAEFRDGLLYLEINLASETVLELSTEGGSVELADESGLFSRSIEGSFRVSVVNPDITALYGILNLESQDLDDNEAIAMKSFAWEEDHLILREELLHFHPQSFGNYASALMYVLGQGFSDKQIRALPMINSTLMVEDSRGEKHYFESPLRLRSSGQLIINGLPYADDFVLEIYQGKLNLNQIVALEEYIAGVLPNEIGPNSPLEALKAQAVAARTHAVSLLLYNRHRDQGFDLCSSTHCQVYKGKHLRNLQIEEAVMQTAGEILTVENRVADATYHSSCGGKTDSSAKIWRSALIPHLSGSVCYPEAADYDLSSESDAARWLDVKPDTEGMSSWERASINWQRSISKAQLAKNAGLNRLESIHILERGLSGRILRLKLVGEREVIIDGEYRIRQAFGGLPSSYFYLKGMKGQSTMSLPSTLSIVGRGSGHGVGMCQVGTLRQARAGAIYTDILHSYYPKTTLTTEWIHHEE